MRSLSANRPGMAAALERPSLPRTPVPTRSSGHDNVDLLQRTLASLEDQPDRRYWTAYDFFMIERQARAMRHAHISGLVAKGWRRLRARLAGPPSTADDPRG